MNPELVKKLLGIPVVKELIVFLGEEAEEMNKLDDIELDDPIEMAVEVKARKRAYGTIVKMLEPLVYPDIRNSNPDIGKEYIT